MDTREWYTNLQDALEAKNFKCSCSSGRGNTRSEYFVVSGIGEFCYNDKGERCEDGEYSDVEYWTLKVRVSDHMPCYETENISVGNYHGSDFASIEDTVNHIEARFQKWLAANKLKDEREYWPS